MSEDNYTALSLDDREDLAVLWSLRKSQMAVLSTRALAGAITNEFVRDSRAELSSAQIAQATAYLCNELARQ